MRGGLSLCLLALAACNSDATPPKAKNLPEFDTILRDAFARKPAHTSQAVALVKDGHAGPDWLVSVHGYPDNFAVCEELIEPYNEDAELSQLPGTYRCVSTDEIVGQPD